MSGVAKSREHHWWPVGIQKYWADGDGNVSWIEPDGRVHKKKVKNRKIARNSHGHSMLRGTVWETNFEGKFQSADDAAPKVIDALLSLRPLGGTFIEFLELIKLFLRRNRKLRDICKFYHLDEQIHRQLLLLLFSLLIRSPRCRSRYESYPKLIGLPSDEDVGKDNMRQHFLTASRLTEARSLSNRYFILIHSPVKKFIFGDGSLDWLSGSLVANKIDGRTLVPLTPQLCVYLCTPHIMRATPNCASVCAPPWMVDRINDLMQVYSRDKLFFVGRPPILSEAFRQRQFLVHKERADPLIELLDEIAGIAKRDSLFGIELLCRKAFVGSDHR